MHQKHSETSKEAYLRLTNENSQCEQILLILRNRGALTGSELAEIMDLPIGTVSARIAHLVASGEAVRSTYTRLHRGRNSTLIYTAVDAAKHNIPVARKKENVPVDALIKIKRIIDDELAINGVVSNLAIRRIKMMVEEGLK